MPTILQPKPPLLSDSVHLSYDDVLLVPQYSEVTPPETDCSTKLTDTITLKIPIIASPMDTLCGEEMALSLFQLGGLGIIHRNLPVQEQARLFEWVKERGGDAGVALGVGADFKPRLERLKQCGAHIFCIDSAHGHSKQVIEATAYLKDTFPDACVISGNVATYEGACALFEAGADVLRIGIGPGSICSTRIVTGVGVPQLSAIFECRRAAEEYGKTLIADGGIRTSGDIVKALAAGASLVMLGFLLAGTKEALGKTFESGGSPYKQYRGMGSEAAMKLGSATRYGLSTAAMCHAPQGVEGKVPYKGSVSTYIPSLIDGLRAGMGYLGARTLQELQERARFIQQSPAAFRESNPHSIEKL